MRGASSVNGGGSIVNVIIFVEFVDEWGSELFIEAERGVPWLKVMSVLVNHRYKLLRRQGKEIFLFANREEATIVRAKLLKLNEENM